MSSKSTTKLTHVSIANTGPLKRIERHLYWIAIIAKVIVFLLFILLLLQIPTGGENLI
jgi:uncharacterized membrane protein YhaH (DUF805 family)